MKKVIATILSLALALAVAVPAIANIPNGFEDGERIQISKTIYDEFAATKESANNKIVKNVGDVAGIDFVCSNKEGWYLNVTDELDGTIEVAYKIGSEYFTVAFKIDGTGMFYVGDGSGKNGINHAKVGEFVEKVPDTTPVTVNLGFIGYYLFEDQVLSTSIHWQNLEKEGDMIDWDAVDAAYDEWVANGGLRPDRTLWQTSGYASFTFSDYAALGYGDFNDGQLENYYLAYYVDPGYVIPEEPEEPGEPGESEPGESEPEVPVNKGCENCEGNAPAFRCDGSGCAGNGKGAPGGNQGNQNN